MKGLIDKLLGKSAPADRLDIEPEDAEETRRANKDFKKIQEGAIEEAKKRLQEECVDEAIAKLKEQRKFGGPHLRRKVNRLANRIYQKRLRRGDLAVALKKVNYEKENLPADAVPPPTDT